MCANISKPNISLKTRRPTFFTQIEFVDRRILKLWNREMFGRDLSFASAAFCSFLFKPIAQPPLSSLGTKRYRAYPDQRIHSLRVSKSVDWRVFWSSDSLIDWFWCSKTMKYLVGLLKSRMCSGGRKHIHAISFRCQSTGEKKDKRFKKKTFLTIIRELVVCHKSIQETTSYLMPQMLFLSVRKNHQLICFPRFNSTRKALKKKPVWCRL